MKPINSGTITWLEEARSKIGTPHGGRGLATRESSAEVGAWLGRQAVKDMDAAAVSRASSHGVALKIRYETRFPSGPNGERLPSYDVAVGCAIDGAEDARKAALADLVNFQTPAAPRLVEDWLAELSVTTAGRNREGIDAALTLNVYASRLSGYPADVVRSALTVKTWKWWPAWDELKSYCDAKAGPRRHMIAALQRPVPDQEPDRRPATKEERARIAALVDELFPNRSQEMRDRAVSEALSGDCMVGAAK